MLRIMEVPQARASLLSRPEWDDAPVSPAQAERTKAIFGEAIGPEECVRRILADLRQRRDEALRDWTFRLDGVDLPPQGLRVDTRSMAEAAARLDPGLRLALEESARRVYEFHLRQPSGSWMHPDPSGILGQKICPIGRVACYVPGGSAPLASTLIMSVMVAKAAGVPRIVVVSPPQRTTGQVAEVILAAAHICGVEEMYAAGGAQAIGALAYGTPTIPRVDKIVGPGNTFVVLAKRQVFGLVGIDALPGPTETVVVADDTADPAWVAADMMAQSEHSAGTALLLTPSIRLAEAVDRELIRQVAALSTRQLVEESFAARSGAVICKDLTEAVALADEWAPEHLCLSVADPWAWLGKINRAGGVFLGEHSYEVLGDYVAGPSHTMPTGGSARFASPCNVWDFVRVMNVIALGPEAAARLGPVAGVLADSEGLSAHAASARIRLPEPGAGGRVQ